MSDKATGSALSRALAGSRNPSQLERSQANRQFPSGSQRDQVSGKGRCDLLPPDALLRLAECYEKGALKYEDRNWEKGQPLSVFLDSGHRHLLKWVRGDTDEDHLIAAVWNLLGAVAMEERCLKGILPMDLIDIPPLLGVGVSSPEDTYEDHPQGNPHEPASRPGQGEVAPG